MMRGRRYVAIAALAVLATACGTPRASAAALTAAVADTSATTSRVALSTTLSSPGITTTITATGQFDDAHSRGVLVLGGATVPGYMEVRYLPPRVYVKYAEAGLPLPTGKEWIEISLLSQGADSSLAFLPMGNVNASPVDLLAALTAIASNVTDLGPATIRGVAVTHYRITVDLAKAEAHLPPQARAEFHSFVSSLASGTTPVDVWVDGQARVSRIEISLPMPPGSGTPVSFRVTETVDFYDFGVPVEVSPPPLSEVMSVSEFSQSLPSSFGASYGSSSPASPPAVSGTRPEAQASAAEQAVSSFLTALSGNSVQAVEQTVMPSQRSCVAAFLQGATAKFKISSLKVTSAEPTGTGEAAVWFLLNGTVQMGGQSFPLAAPVASETNWLQARQIGSVWYADLSNTDSGLPLPPCGS